MINPTEVYDRALTTWGAEAQVNQAIEEAAELILALRHFQRSKATAEQVIDEIADMEIMCSQMRRIFGEVLVDARKEAKLERLIGTLDEVGRPQERRAKLLRDLGCKVGGFTLEH